MATLAQTSTDAWIAPELVGLRALGYRTPNVTEDPVHRFIQTLAAALALGAPIAGCAQSDEDQVRGVVHAFHDDVVRGDGEAACARLVPAAQRRFAESMDEDGCASAVRSVATLITAHQRELLEKVEIKRVRIRGDRAEIRPQDVAVPEDLRMPNSPDSTVLRRVGDEWLLEWLG